MKSASHRTLAINGLLILPGPAVFDQSGPGGIQWILRRVDFIAETLSMRVLIFPGKVNRETGYNTITILSRRASMKTPSEKAIA